MLKATFVRYRNMEKSQLFSNKRTCLFDDRVMFARVTINDLLVKLQSRKVLKTLPYTGSLRQQPISRSLL